MPCLSGVSVPGAVPLKGFQVCTYMIVLGASARVTVASESIPGNSPGVPYQVHLTEFQVSLNGYLIFWSTSRCRFGLTRCV